MKIVKIYEQVKAYIEQDARQKSPGEYLPSEVQYSEQLNVSRPTVRKAVTELVDTGLIQRVPGKGLMVGNGARPSNRGKILVGLPFAPGDGFIFRIVMSCINTANRLGYEYKVISTLDPAERTRLIAAENAEDYVAIVLAVYDSPNDRQLLETLTARNAPLLLVDNRPDQRDLPVIGCNDFEGGYLMGKHLLDQGHRKIMYITSTRQVQTVHDRLSGFLQAAKDAGLDSRDIFEYAVTDIGHPTVAHSFDSSFRAEILTERGITALCGYSSLPVISLCNLLVLKGWQIPQDLSVIGYGDHGIITAINKPITTIDTHADEMGQAIVECIDQSVKRREPIQGRMIPIALDQRNSVRKLS